jgi:hypothetical protein
MLISTAKDGVIIQREGFSLSLTMSDVVKVLGRLRREERLLYRTVSDPELKAVRTCGQDEDRLFIVVPDSEVE